MPTGCCGGSTCSCQIIGEGQMSVEGSGLPNDPFVLSVDSDFDQDMNETFHTIPTGSGSSSDPWKIQVHFATSAKLDHVPDVDASTATNGQVLTWNSTAGKWVAGAPTTAPTGAVLHDPSLTGDGSAGAPLAVAPNGARYIGVQPAGVGLNDQGLASVVHHFVNGTARTTAIPAPGFNMLSMLDTGAGVIQYWNGVAWTGLPNQTEWSATQSLLELSGPYNPGLRPVVMVLQVDGTTDAEGVMDVVTPAELAGRSGVLITLVQETGPVAWKGMVHANVDRISVTAYRVSDGSVMAGTPLTATVQAICY